MDNQGLSVAFLMRVSVALVLLAAGCAAGADKRSATSAAKAANPAANAVRVAGAPGGADLWMDQTETSVSRYAACVSAGKCSPPRTDWKTCNWTNRGARGSHPVNCVTWQQADSFCRWSGKRLPTEQEWEFAASSDKAGKYPWGDGNWTGNTCYGQPSTCAVGRFPADSSRFGVLDVAGNVKEWTASIEKLPEEEARVIRGGAWEHSALASEPMIGIRLRDALPAKEYASDLGFRCVSEKAPAEGAAAPRAKPRAASR
jgi:formylglycine-generating enzyme required for sulfatase activity